MKKLLFSIITLSLFSCNPEDERLDSIFVKFQSEVDGHVFLVATGNDTLCRVENGTSIYYEVEIQEICDCEVLCFINQESTHYLTLSNPENEFVNVKITRDTMYVIE